VSSGILLTRCDPAHNLYRYYRLEVQRDLFGAWCLIREWGRIGQSGQRRSTPYPTAEQAQAALERQRRCKEQRGYAPLCTSQDELMPEAMAQTTWGDNHGGLSVK
jgi:predicted DNA-binding WGR domain protein